MFRAEGWVLVTGDDRMPADHGELIDEPGVTVAIIDPRATRAVTTTMNRAAMSCSVGPTSCRAKGRAQ
jgi:hypothetical protein